MIKRVENARVTHKSEHEAYEYTKKEIIGRADALQCSVQ